MSICLPRVRGRERFGLRAALALALAALTLVAVGAPSAEGAPRAEGGPRGHGAPPSHLSTSAPGPLVVSRNPRYFTVAPGHRDSGRAVYLTGSHVWNNVQSGVGPGQSCAASPERNDYDAYLDFLDAHGHNFIRLWRWEHFKSQLAGFHLCMTPQPWQRSGPGSASDGQPKYDLTRFDEDYFRDLRSHIVAAGDRGIYTSVMLFEGLCLVICTAPDNIAGHPFAAGNNVNDIGIQSPLDYVVLPLSPAVQRLQEAYIRKVVDAVHDLPNVLYEVSNETTGDAASPSGDSTPWQYWVIDYVKRYEQARNYVAHPIGMTFQYPDARRNGSLFDGPADWVSPGFTTAPYSDAWYTDPPANDGTTYRTKVVLTDTDHYAPGIGDALWAWKSFTRGLNPLLMDYGIIDVVNPLDPSTGVPSYESLEPVRFAMGDTLSLASRVNLLDMTPRGAISSTGYALAGGDGDAIVLQPSAGGPFSVELGRGRYAVEWYSLDSRQTTTAAPLRVREGASVGFTPPFAAPAVVWLHRIED